jgi:thioesterase domain-containing protein
VVLQQWGFRPALILPLPRAEIPKTSLGKIQRSLLRQRLEAGALSAHQTATAALVRRQMGDFVVPQGDKEWQLARIFGQLFERDAHTISATDSFFDLGGTSIDLLRLRRKVAERFDGRDLPLAAVFSAPSVRELGRRLQGEEAGGDLAYDPIVALQTSGDQTPLFCIHPGVGEVLVFVNLAKYFSDERPLYALRARGFGPGETHFASFDEMVATYVRGIRHRQPHGPYALAGYSFGGVVAFEVAKALEQAGEVVDFLGIINVPPHIKAGRQQIDFAYTAVNLAFLLALIPQERVEELTTELRSEAQPRAEQCARLLRLAPRARLLELDLNLVKLVAWAELAYDLVRIGQSYEPQGSVRAATVLYASPPVRQRGLSRQDWLQNQLRRWDDFSRDPVTYIELEGEHQSLMARHLGGFQAALRRALAASTRASSPRSAS